MSEILSPGVVIEEIPATVQIVQAVSTSNCGVVGFTIKGPTNKATLVTSFDDFVNKFGSFTTASFVPLSAAAFFANGGRRLYVVRTVPSDAVAATAKIISKTTDQQTNTGDGVTATVTDATLTPVPLKVNTGASPIVPKSVTFRWRASGVGVIGQQAKQRDGLVNLAAVAGTLKYDGRISPAVGNLPAFDNVLYAVVPVLAPGTSNSISWVSGAANKTILINYPNAVAAQNPIVTCTNAAGSAVTFDHRTGRFSLLIAIAETPDNATAISMNFFPCTDSFTITDDGAGVFTSAVLAVNGSINYNTGAYSFQTIVGDTPHNMAKIVCTYSIFAWSLNPISAGAWANDMRLSMHGSIDSYNAATATYSKMDLQVQLLNSATGNYDPQEVYSEIDFSDVTSAFFFPDVLNELSNYMTVVEPGGNEAPLQLNGVNRSIAVAGGDEAAAGQTIQISLPNAPLSARSITLTYTDAGGTVQSVSDNGAGKMTGSIDITGNNTINYATGAMDVKVFAPIKANTLVLVTYCSQPAESVHTEQFGDTTKGYIKGTDGTFSSATYGRLQVTSPILKQPAQGIYALDKVEELMQVIVPDFAGDQIVTDDILDYVDGRANQPSGGDRFAILTTPRGMTPQQAVDWFRFTLKRFSKFAAMYWPWVKVSDPLANNRPVVMPALGHVAGIYARTDNNKNVGKAPGGTVDGQLRFLLGLESDSTLGDRDLLYPARINPLISGPQTGMAVWGVRTISLETEWRYINVRRLFMFLEKSVFNATHWIVFENNGPALWGKIKAQLNGFFLALFNEGYFAGKKPAEGFFVVCDETNNRPETIELGQVIIDIGVAANKPAEFVRFRFSQQTLAS